MKARKELVESFANDHYLEQAISTERLLELYRLAVEGLEPDVLTRANWFSVMRLNKQKRYREVVTLCKFVRDEAYGYLGIHIISSNLLYNLAKAQEHIGEVEEALSNYQEALEICSHQCQINEGVEFYTNLKASILHDLADLYEKQGNYQKALELCLQVIQIDEVNKNELGKAKSLNQLAGIKRALGDVEEALKVFQQAHEFAKKSGDQALVSAIQNNIAILQVDLGQIDAWDNSLLDLAQGEAWSKDWEDRITILSNTAALRLKQGDREEARKILEQLAALLPSIDNFWLKAALLHNLATFRSECGERKLALDLYNQALELHRNNGSQLHEAMTLQEIGILYERQNNTSEALKFLEESYRLSLNIGDKDTQAHVLLRTAAILVDQGNLDRAEDKLNIALEISSTIKSPDRCALALREMGRLQIKRGNYHAGADYLRQALGKCSSVIEATLRATILKLLGEIESFLCEIDIAVEHLRESLNIYQKLDSIKDIEEVKRLIEDAQLKEPAQLYQAAIAKAEEGNARAAISLFEQALPMVEQIGDQEIRARILLSIGNLLIDEGDYREGFEKSSQAIKIAKDYNLAEREGMENIALYVQYGRLKHLFDTAHEKCERQKFGEALDLAHQCLELVEILGDADWHAEIFTLLGQIKVHQDDYEGGIQDLKKAIYLTRENQLDGFDELTKIIDAVNSRESARLHDQAYSAAQQGNLEEAVDLAKKAYEFQCSVNHQNTQPATLGMLGQLLLVQGKFVEGLEQLYKALDIAQKLQASEAINQLEEIIAGLANHENDHE
jgi:tetratricopeptide (TPR) repeat protein